MEPGRFHAEPDGWHRWEPGPGPGIELFVRFEASDTGRLEVRGVRIEGPVGTEALRAVPLGRIEAAANAQLGEWSAAVPSGAELPRRATKPPAATGDTWDPGSDRTEGAIVGQRPQRGRPDAFYAELADDYRALVVQTSRPAVVIAERRGVPLSTAHRWIKEARRRRLLPPGRVGKAG